jgi:fatty-acid desaturase
VDPANARTVETSPQDNNWEFVHMNLLFIIIIVIAVILAITGGLVSSVNFLLWVGIVLLILAVIAWLIRSLTGRSRV